MHNRAAGYRNRAQLDEPLLRRAGGEKGGGGSVVCRLRIHFTGRILDTGLGLAVKVECCCGRREQRTSSIVQRETHNAQRAIFAARRRRGHIMVPHAIPCTYLLLSAFASTLLSGITAHQSTTPPRSAQKEVHGVRLRFAHRNFRCNSTLLKATLYILLGIENGKESPSGPLFLSTQSHSHEWPPMCVPASRYTRPLYV